jgi:hypothetical protein
VVANGADGQAQLPGDLGGRHARRSQPQHVRFTGGHRVDGRLQGGEGQVGVEGLHPLGDLADGLADAVRVGVLAQEPGGVRGDRLTQVTGARVGGHDQGVAAGGGIVQVADDGEPVGGREAVIDDRHVWLQRGRGGQHRFAAIQFGDHLHVGLA